MNSTTLELKSLLDKNPKYREMLFRRGYLVSDKKVKDKGRFPFYGLWMENQIGKYYLYVHEKQTCYIQQEGDVYVSIIGHAYNPFNMMINEDDYV